MTRRILSLILLSALSLTSFAQSEEELVKSTIDKNTIKGHIYFLASDELRGRETGSAEIEIAARYLSTTLQRYGVAPVPGAKEGYFQEVPLVQSLAPTEYTLLVGSKSIAREHLYRMEGEGIQSLSDLVYVGHGSEEDFKGKSLEGKVVVALAGTKEASDLRTVFMESEKKTERAKQGKAIGLIELHTEALENWATAGRYLRTSSFQFAQKEESKPSTFFKLWVKDEDKSIATSMLSRKRQKVDVKIGMGQKNPVPSKNVVGMVEGTDPELKNEFIIYSAHYDHIGVGKANAEGDSIFNGARDNAVGVVTVLSVAENLAKNPTKRSALFILFTAEEKGLWGSRYYAENPLLPLEQMVYCFNSDNGGYNDTTVATIVGLGRTTAEKHIIKASETFGLRAIDDPAGEQGLFDRSDNVNFAKKGIPAPTFSMGFTAFDAEIMKYYHQQADNPESIDYEYLEKFFRAYVLASRLIANDPETPFWLEGDKYYPVGVELYKK